MAGMNDCTIVHNNLIHYICRTDLARGMHIVCRAFLHQIANEDRCDNGEQSGNLRCEYRETAALQRSEKIQAGDKQARDEFIQGNLRLVLSVIQRFSNRGENPDDLFQVGCIGLIKALDNFDLSHGVKFSTYAVPMIIGEIRRYLRDNNTIRVSRSMRDLAYKALQTKEQLSGSLQREPSVEEIAKAMDIDREDIVLALESIQEPVSLFEPVYHDDGDALYVMDQVQDTKNTDVNWIENLSLSEAMKKLTPRERHILNMRFFEGKTQMEVAKEISISQAQVSRLEKNALKYMRKYV